MPKLAVPQQEAVQVALGYGYLPYPHFELLPLGYEITAAAINEIQDLLSKLEAIDEKLDAATLDSMAVNVDKLTLSYPQHIRHLKSEGSRHLNRIANLIGLAIAYNKYTGTGKSSTQSVVSYW